MTWSINNRAFRQQKNLHTIKYLIDPYLFVMSWLCRLLRLTSQWILRCMNLCLSRFFNFIYTTLAKSLHYLQSECDMNNLAFLSLMQS